MIQIKYERFFIDERNERFIFRKRILKLFEMKGDEKVMEITWK